MCPDQAIAPGRSHRLLAITQTREDPATRYRVALYVPHLSERGIETTVEPWPSDERGRQGLLERVADFDSVVVQRRLPSRRHTKMLRARAKWLGYDFDDAIIFRDSYHGYPWPLVDKVIRFRGMISLCDAVTAGNPYLASLATRFTGQDVRIIPTVPDVRRYTERPGALRSPCTTAGWMGLHTNLRYLFALQGALRDISRNVPGFKLMIVGDRQSRIDGVRMEYVRWEKDTETEALSGMCAGLAPLADNRWTRGKCGLRLLQYLAAGVPAIASPVGTQQTIADGGACLIARSSEEWIAGIRALLSDQALRDDLKQKGRELVRQKFTAELWADAIASAWTGSQPGRRGHENRD